MSTLEDVRAHVVELEKDADGYGWDQQPVLFRVYFDILTGEMCNAVVPLSGMHPHPPSAIEILAEMLECGLPPEIWPRVGEVALIVVNEAWQRSVSQEPEEYQAEMRAWYGDNKDADDDAIDRKILELREKYHGTMILADIPGSLETRIVAVQIGKRSYMYRRIRGQEPEWLDEVADPELGWEAKGRIYDALVRVQRASRVSG